MKLKHLGLVILLITISLLIAKAGNILSSQQITITNSKGTPAGNGQRAEYIFTTNPTVVFDADYPQDLAADVISDINSKLVDIQLQYEFSPIDYDHALDILPVRYEPNRIFLHLGRGWSNDFSASLRTFSNNTATCFIIHNKVFFDQAIYSTQKLITTHEIFHCLRWAHASDNPYVGNFDFDNQDNVEVLYRAYDTTNQKQMVTVYAEGITGFVAQKKVRYNSVYTKDNEVKLIPGEYKIQVNNKYFCGKNGRKLCKSIKKAKKFVFNN